MNRDKYFLYGLLGLVGLGLLMLSLNRFEAYQRFVNLEPTRPAPAGSSQPAAEKNSFARDRATPVPEPSDTEKEHGDVSAPIDLNTAGLDELMRLPGIGRVIGLSIIEYRGRVGGFESVEQLLEVKGIGRKRLEILKDCVIISGNEQIP